MPSKFCSFIAMVTVNEVDREVVRAGENGQTHPQVHSTRDMSRTRHQLVARTKY